MRLYKKFKVFKQLRTWHNLDYIPIKLIKTQKKSWKMFLSTYKSSIQKQRMHDSMADVKPVIKSKHWDFNKKAYKNGLDIKRYYFHIFDHIIRNKTLKRIKDKECNHYKQNMFVNTLLYLFKPTLRLDILLWTLGFYNSIYEARKNILLRKILLNTNKNPHPNNTLNSGDIINIMNFSKELSFKDINSKKIYLKKKFKFFCEIDYYSKTVIVINDFIDVLQSNDNPQIFFNGLDIRKFISYLKREY